MSAVQTNLERQNRPIKKRRAVFWLVFLVFIIVLTIISSVVSYNYVIKSVDEKDKAVVINIDPTKGIPVDIPLGSGTNTIAGLLKSNDIIKHPYIFKLISKLNGYDGIYQSGTHILSKDLSYDQIMRVLSDKPESVRVTIPEGYAFDQITKAISNRGIIDINKFNKIADTEKFDYKFLKNIKRSEHRLEGYLFPDTYEFDMRTGEQAIIDRMLGRFDDIFTDEYYKQASKLDLSIDQIIIMASIVEREAKDPEERAKIAGVFYNRLKNRDASLKKLQSCATLQYILLKRDGHIKEKLTLEDEKIDDPYNTYMYEGLPPGPICSPGKDSIEAALYPEKHNYLYFVVKADGSGTHVFSRTYKEHLRAVNEMNKKSK